MIHIDIQYINELAPRLEQFTQQKSNLWNFRCPICGDSQRNKLKRRAYIYEKQCKLNFKCHNCDIGMSLANFIKTLDNALYKRYCLDSFGDTNNKTIKKKKVQHHRVMPKILKGATRLNQLASNHIARQFVDARMIPKKFHHKLYYTDNFSRFIDTTDIKPAGRLGREPRLIIPFFDKNSKVFAIQCRALNNNGLRYITFRFDSMPYGIDTLDTSKKIYAVEGPIDSMFINNCIGIGSSQIVTNSQTGYIYKFDRKNTTIIYDNERRNKEICAKIELAIKQGFNVCIWPNHIKQKDVNDMVLAGYNVQEIVDNNTYSGLQASLQMNAWKRI